MKVSTTGRTDSPSWIDTQLEAFRCRHCQHKLMMTTREPLKNRALQQIKCSKCKTMNYLFGAET